MFLRWRLVRRRPKRRSSVTKHYLAHKEEARELVHKKLEEWNAHYGLTYKRVAIRNQRRSWGSCTSLKNLNFSYKILFLPARLQDYLIVHELCHLAELNHGKKFWELVAKQIPDYKKRMEELRHLEKNRLIA
jgi:predicted metal-dependent hydrolase